LNNRLVILLVSPPGNLQIGLQALIKAHLEVDVLAIGDISSLFSVIEKQKPDLVILDQDTQKVDAPQIVKEITARWSKMRVFVLVNDDEGHDSFLGMGADWIVTKGIPGLKLIDEIKKAIEEEKLF